MFVSAMAVSPAVSGSARAQVPAKAPPHVTPQANGEFLARMLAIAKHNNLTDVAFTQSVFGPNVVSDKDGHKDVHSTSGLDLIGSGPGTIAVPGMTYYYSLSAMKGALNLWQDDPLFVGEFSIHGIDKYMCIEGGDVSNVFRADPDVGLVASHTFHVAQSANSVTQIEISGPVEEDQKGCINSITITQKHMSEYVPQAAGQNSVP